MDVHHITQWKEVLQDVQDLTAAARDEARQGKYIATRAGSLFTVRELPNNDGISLRPTFIEAIMAAKKAGVDTKDIIIDL